MPHLPSVFVSHGAPTFALEPGQAGPGLAALGRALPRPQAVLVVSPHWMTPQPRIGLSPRPATIHDFGGFDPALYALDYPAPGHPGLARRAFACLQQAGWSPAFDGQRGRDHGAWVPLRHLYPDADVPVFQVSLPRGLDADTAWAFGAALAPLADEDVLLVGSGSLTHNLHEFRLHKGEHGADDEDYVHAFADWVRQAVREGDLPRLRRTLDEAPQARRAHPTDEHFWPLLVAAGAAPAAPDTRVIDGGIAHGVLAMDAFVFGEPATP